MRWINPSGGAFADPANWDTGQAPGPQDTAAFGLPGSYTVTLADSAAVGGLVVEQGTVSLDLGSSQLSVGLQTQGPLQVGTGAAPTATLRLASGRLYTDLAVVSIGAAPGTTSTFMVEPGATYEDSNGTVHIGGAGVGHVLIRGTWTDGGIDKDKYIYAGSTIHVDPTGVLNFRHLYNAGGAVEVDGGRMNVASWNGYGDITARNGARLTTADVFGHSSGAINVLSGATLDAQPCDQADGEILIDGPGSRITGELHGEPSSLILQNGGAVRTAFEVDLLGEPQVFLGPGSLIQTGTDFLLRGGVLHAEPGAALDIGDSFSISNSPVFELALDGASLPSSPIISVGPSRPVLAGIIRPVLAHPNNLRVGDQVEVLRWSSAAGFVSHFSGLEHAPLGGGRGLQLLYTDGSVLLQVVAGGPPCWSVDFNGDGDIGTDADIEAFFACIAGNCCPTCASADFDGDGQESTDGDIEAFFRVLSGGPC